MTNLQFLLNAYLLISLLLLGFTASIWSSHGWSNKLMKFIFVGTALAGCVLLGKLTI